MTRRAASRTALAGLALLALVGLAPPAGAAPGQAGPDESEPTTVPTLRVVTQDLEVAPDGDFRVYLEVGDAPAGSDLAVNIYDRIQDPADLAASTTDQPADLLDNFDPIDLEPTAVAEQQTGFTIYLYGPDQPRRTDVPAPNFAYELDEPGVYPVKVRLRGPDQDDLTSIVTYLVRRPDGGVTVGAPAEVALVATVHQPPPPVGDDPDEAAAAELVDPAFLGAVDELLAELEARPELPVTFDVTPDTAQRMDADPDATDTLEALRTELGRTGRTLVASPYVDLDPAALVDVDLRDELIRQNDLGRRTLATVLDGPGALTDPGAATWVVDHPVDEATVGALADLGLTHLVLPADATGGGAPSTRLALPGGGGRIDAITSAPDDLASGSPIDPVLAGNQLLGRLAATASINPAGTVLALHIDPQAVDAVELATVLDGLATPGTYVRAATIDQAFTDTPLAPTPPALTAPEPAGLRAYASSLNRTQQLLSSYASMVPDQPERIATFEQPLARAASADLEVSDRRSRVRTEQQALERRLGAVSVPERDRVTLGARNARFPLPVTSTLAGPVKVVITLEASDRLSFPEDRIEATLRDDRTIVQIPVRTRATGDTPLRITVRSPDGNQVLATSQYTVRSTAVSGVGLLLTIGAAAFLALWWGRHWWRARGQAAPPSRHGRRPDTGPDPGPDDDDLFVPDAADAAPVPATDGDVTAGAERGSKPD